MLLTMKRIWGFAVLISLFKLFLVGVSGNSSNLTDYEKFEAFKKHNCLPVIVLEGVEGTKL